MRNKDYLKFAKETYKQAYPNAGDLLVYKGVKLSSDDFDFDISLSANQFAIVKNGWVTYDGAGVGVGTLVLFGLGGETLNFTITSSAVYQKFTDGMIFDKFSYSAFKGSHYLIYELYELV